MSQGHKDTGNNPEEQGRGKFLRPSTASFRSFFQLVGGVLPFLRSAGTQFHTFFALALVSTVTRVLFNLLSVINAMRGVERTIR